MTITFDQKQNDLTHYFMIILFILIGVALIDIKLWKMMAAQGRHYKNVEKLLTEIRDKQTNSGEKITPGEITLPGTWFDLKT